MDVRLAQLQEAGPEFLPGLLGIEFTGLEDGVVQAQLELRKEHFAPNGYVHAGTVVTLADTAAGYGCLLQLPEGGTGFTTIELKTNFLRSANEGTIACEPGSSTAAARPRSGTRPSAPPTAAMALFRCTQLVLRPS